MFIVASNVVASRPPERRPTGTPTTRAKIPNEGIIEMSYSIRGGACYQIFHWIRLINAILLGVVQQLFEPMLFV